ncbi:MAG TPA: putative glycolipid-binding domain-containing protein [Candidatus Binataceae bacterium]|nr:putative glycolipid-binding domain-containing protein [Candidatus Binataceae bacterium]
MSTIIARWQDWSGLGVEHLVLNERSHQIVADAAVIGSVDDRLFAVRYQIICDAQWRVKRIGVGEVGSERAIEFVSDGAGKWVDGSGASQPQLATAIDVDISITPFTNTLPIRRLHLQKGESREIVVVYIQLPNLSMTTDRQRYTCLDARHYLYESVDSDFKREIEVDGRGLVTEYPGLFRRIL